MDIILHGLLRQPHAGDVILFVVARANFPTSHEQTMRDNDKIPFS